MINSLIMKGYKQIRKCRGDENCYYRAVYYAYLEILIYRGPKIFNSFKEMIQNHNINNLKKIKNENLFKIVIAITEQIYQKLILNGTKAALQHLFQSILLIPEFDTVFIFLY